jgi:hypothetical protein
MMCKYIENDKFMLKLRESCEYTHHILEYNKKKIKIIHKEYNWENDEYYVTYIFEILNEQPTKIKIKFDLSPDRIEYVNINKSECIML